MVKKQPLYNIFLNCGFIQKIYGKIKSDKYLSQLTVYCLCFNVVDPQKLVPRKKNSHVTVIYIHMVFKGSFSI